VPDKLLEVAEDVRVPPSLRYLHLHSLQCVSDGESRLIGPHRRERVVHIHDLQHSGCNRYNFSHKPIGITGAVKLFVVVANDGQHGSKGLQGCTDTLPDYGMLTHEFPFVRGKTARLQNNRIGYGNVSDV